MPMILKGTHTTAIHPAYYLDFMLKDKGISFFNLVKGEDISKVKMIKFMKGKADVDSEIAYLLARKLDTSIGLWFNLQKNYKRKLSKVRGELKECHMKK